MESGPATEKSALEKDHAWAHEFLQWHNERIKQYAGRVRVELWLKAREWVARNMA